MNLLHVKDALRTLPRAARRSYRLDVNGLLGGYIELLQTAPVRTQGYLSSTRTGVPSTGASSRREEEHLAIGLFNLGALATAEGQLIRLVDYQFPLKAVRADVGIGKVDLLGLRDDGRIVVIELKAAGSKEDCRVALIEGLIYAAVIERNVHQIVNEIGEIRQLKTAPVRPNVLIAAPQLFWDNCQQGDSYHDLVAVSRYLSETLPISIELTVLDEARLSAYGLAQSRPVIEGSPRLRPIG